MVLTNTHFRKLQNLCDEYDQLAIKPVKFLHFVTGKPFKCLKCVPKHVSKLNLTSLDENSNITEIVQILADFTIKDENIKVKPENKMHQPSLFSSIPLKDINRVCHINCVTSNLIWISDYKNNLLLMRIEENRISVAHRILEDFGGLGVYTVSTTGDLIYIDKGSEIRKLSSDCNTKVSLFKIGNDWRPRCIHYSHFNRDLVIGMWKEKRCRIVRTHKMGRDMA
ncbi:uncharacterized protein LOC134261413 isoform X2 [Saccostrea cucullata]|uniref:uncharacterized protein LOC134261413 isoform X2 n=1 Tax=Saccostrea cuccullata TaxID=36930 RepID=UPI002ED699AE